MFSLFGSNNKDLEKCDVELDLILDCSNNVILIFDQNEKVIEANYQVKKHFDIESASIVGKTIDQLPFFDNSSARTKKFLQIKDTSGVAEFEEIDGIDKYKNKIVFEAKMKRSGERGVVIIHDIPVTSNFSEDPSGLKFLSDSSVKLLELMSQMAIYQYVADKLAYLAPDSYIFINMFVGPRKIKVVASATSSKVLGRGLKVIGGSPVGKTFELNDEADFSLNQDKLHVVRGGVNELTFGAVPKPVAKLAEKVAGIKECFAIGFFWKGKRFGSATIISRQESGNLKNAPAIETFINLVSVTLQRIKVETQLEQALNALHEEKERINTILLSIGDGVFVVDNNLKITVFNETASRISGLKAKDIIGKNFRDFLKFINEDSKKDASQFITDCISTGNVSNVSKGTVLQTVSGDLVPVDNSAAPLKDEKNQVIGCVIVFRDVTEERQVDKAKTEFVSLASHQLKSPLTAINWYCDLLLEDKEKCFSESQNKYIKEIHASSNRMVDLVNALLNVSRLELGTFIVEPQQVDIKEITKGVITEMAPLMENNKISFSENYGEIKKIPLDPKLTRIIFQNLLSNAFKYTPNGGKVDLNISIKDKNYVISVADTGYGIPKKDQGKIFTKLFRADNIRSRDVEGTGLGLYIVKSIVENSGGKIWFSSEENKGTEFFVEIPITGMKKKEGTKQLS